MPFEDIEVLHGDTQVSPRGMDTYGSRSLAVGGIAVVKAAEKVVAKARTIAAHLLEASEDDLEFSGGRFGVRGTGKGVTIQEVATAVWAAHDLPDGVEPSLDSDATYDPDNFSFPHGTHLAAMEVDTETGRVTIRRYVCVDDIGNAVNPLIVEGQVHGGLAQGIAQALFEEANSDERARWSTARSSTTPCPRQRTCPASPRTAPRPRRRATRWVSRASARPARSHRRRRSSSVLDAVRHLGVRDVEMPCTPQRVWRAIQAGQGRATQETPVDTHSPGAGLGSIDPNNPQEEEVQ